MVDLVRKSASSAFPGELTTGVQVIPGAKEFLAPITPTGGIAGNVGSAAPSAGQIGEVKSSIVSVSTNIPGASGAYGDVGSVLLTPGIWLINYSARVLRNGATFSSVDLLAGVSTTSGNSGTGLASPINMVNFGLAFLTTFNNADLPGVSFIVRSDGTTITRLDDNTAFAAGQTLYLKLYVSSFTVATPQYTSKLTAARFV